MHPIYSAYLRQHLTAITGMIAMLVAGITAIIYSLTLLNRGRDTAVLYLIPAVIMTLSAADILRKRFFTSKKHLNFFLSQIKPEQNARMLAEFRCNSYGEVLAGDYLILLNKQLEFIDADTVTITNISGRTTISGADINGRIDRWYINDESIAEKLRLRIRDRRRSVVREGGRR